jgi:hypothetical protein
MQKKSRQKHAQEKMKSTYHNGVDVFAARAFHPVGSIAGVEGKPLVHKVLR